MPKRKTGRPRTDEPHEIRVVFLLTEAQFDALKSQPEVDAMPPGSLARLWVIQELQRRGAL